MKPMRMRALFGVVCVFLGSASAPPAAKPGIPERVDRATLMDVVRTLSAPEFEGRATGTDGAARARAFIARRFEEIGLRPLTQGGFVLPAVAAAPSDEGTLPKNQPVANVVGLVKGGGAAAHVIVVSAHYDHLGIVEGVLYPGADDNASGVAVLLAAAAYFATHQPRHDLVFAAFDAEEKNLMGSEAFVTNPPIPIERMRLAINLDMVSRSDRGEIFAAGISHHPSLRPALDEVRRRAPVRLLFGHDRAEEGKDDWTRDSDHWPFHKAGVPFLYFGVEDHPDYHRPTDTVERIDPKFFLDVANTILDAVVTLDERLD
jgi:Zn-dependent M28 family amino/carboxypeptidase